MQYNDGEAGQTAPLPECRQSAAARQLHSWLNLIGARRERARGDNQGIPHQCSLHNLSHLFRRGVALSTSLYTSIIFHAGPGLLAPPSTATP